MDDDAAGFAESENLMAAVKMISLETSAASWPVECSWTSVSSNVAGRDDSTSRKRCEKHSIAKSSAQVNGIKPLLSLHSVQISFKCLVTESARL